VLYLAEVQKQKTGFIGAAKTELKLLAVSRADQGWNALPREEVIPAPEANNLNDGTLVLADLNPNRQVQRLQDAGRPLVSILQNLSRQLEKTKSQEEEIAQWKQSLTYQSQELNSRQMEMEARLEQLQQMEEEFKQLDLQRQEIYTAQKQMQRLREEVERNRRELEAAWEHVRRTESQQTTGLDEDQVRCFGELLVRTESGVASIGAVQEQLDLSFEVVATQQGILTEHWQQLEQQRHSAYQQQEEIDRQSQVLPNSLREWQQAQDSLSQAKANLQVETTVLTSKQEYAQMLSLQLRHQEDLYQQIYSIAHKSSTSDKISEQVDVTAWEEMPLDELEQMVQTNMKIMQKASQFVNEQEEELSFLQEAIAQLQVKLQQASEHDGTHLNTKLVEEQDCYRMLNETLVGQRQNLREREEILSQYQRVLLRRRDGTLDGQEEQNVDLEPILAQIKLHRDQQSEELQEQLRQLEQMRDRTTQAQEMIAHQSQEQEMKWQELQSLEQNLLSLRAATAELWGRVNLYQETLQPVQDCLDGLRHRLEAVAETLAQVKETNHNQLQTITQLHQTLTL